MKKNTHNQPEVESRRSRVESRTPALALALFIFLAGLFFATGADLTTGYTFSAGEQNVTHTKLNTAVNSATINTGFLTDKSASTAPSTSDLLLIYDSASGTFKKITVANFATSNTTISNMVDNGTSNAAVVAVTRNLVVTNSSASAVRVTADEFILKNAAGNPRIVSSLNVAAAITSSGAGGLDTGSEAASTWYYIWVIGDGLTLSNALLSTSATAPTMPTGYTYRGLAGAVYNTAASDFRDFRQVGKYVGIAQTQFATNQTIVSAGQSQVLDGNQQAWFQTLCPTIAVGLSGLIERTDTTSTGTQWMRVSPDQNSTGSSDGAPVISFPTNPPSTVYFQSFRIPFLAFGANRNFTFTASSANSTVTWNFFLTGFELP